MWFKGDGGMDITGDSRPHNILTTKSCEIDKKKNIYLI